MVDDAVRDIDNVGNMLTAEAQQDAEGPARLMQAVVNVVEKLPQGKLPATLERELLNAVKDADIDAMFNAVRALPTEVRNLLNEEFKRLGAA